MTFFLFLLVRKLEKLELHSIFLHFTCIPPGYFVPMVKGGVNKEI